MVTYNVGLCRMVNGNLEAPYEGASIEAANISDALLKAKKWAAAVAASAALSRDRFDAPSPRSECRPDEYATQIEHETESGRPGKDH
jgi:ribosomal protein L12E/L44/L45/RPP1/RPP2